MAFRTEESLDTNMILRIMLKDVPGQCLKIVDLFMRQGVRYHVADLAITEAVYVMQRDYSREEIVSYLRNLFTMNEIRANFALFEKVFPMYLEYPKLSFNDCCLAVYAELNEAEPLWTFDRKLASQVSNVKLVEG